MKRRISVRFLLVGILVATFTATVAQAGWTRFPNFSALARAQEVPLKGDTAKGEIVRRDGKVIVINTRPCDKTPKQVTFIEPFEGPVKAGSTRCGFLGWFGRRVELFLVKKL